MTENTHHWGFRRSDAETLRHDAGVVCCARAVPQQLSVVKLLEGTEALALSFSANFEDLKNKKKCLRKIH